MRRAPRRTPPRVSIGREDQNGEQPIPSNRGPDYVGETSLSVGEKEDTLAHPVRSAVQETRTPLPAQQAGALPRPLTT